MFFITIYIIVFCKTGFNHFFSVFMVYIRDEHGTRSVPNSYGTEKQEKWVPVPNIPVRYRYPYPYGTGIYKCFTRKYLIMENGESEYRYQY
ncbi:hypothetical protein Hdeb2414_s0003g00082991 [Helianthus debilis subsp. tardiflorus]